jgi:hypothetical protein
MKKTLYDFPTTVRLVGPVRQAAADEDARRLSYHAIRYAVKYKRVVEPKQCGKAMLFTAEQVETLKRHFGLAVDQARGGTQSP